MKASALVAVVVIGAIAAILISFAFWIVMLPSLFVIAPVLNVIGFVISLLIIIGFAITILDEEKS
jgi:hypothetical protein